MRHFTMSVKEVTLECTAPNCDLGQSGGRYKTPMLEVMYAMEMLRSHLQQNHEQGQVGNQGRQEPGLRPLYRPGTLHAVTPSQDASDIDPTAETCCSASVSLVARLRNVSIPNLWTCRS